MPLCPQFCRKDKIIPYTLASSEEKFITNLEVKNNMKPEGCIHSKMPGIKYRILLYLPLSCGHLSYFEGEIKKRRCPHSLFAYVTLPKGEEK